MSLKGNVAKPKHFQAKISNCGTDAMNGTYDIAEDKSAMRLMSRIFGSMSRSLAGRNLEAAFMYDFAILLLASLEGYDKDSLMDWIQKAKDDNFKALFEAWTLKDPQEAVQ